MLVWIASLSLDRLASPVSKPAIVRALFYGAHMWTPEAFIGVADHVAWTAFQVWVAITGIHILISLMFGEAGDDE